MVNMMALIALTLVCVAGWLFGWIISIRYALIEEDVVEGANVSELKHVWAMQSQCARQYADMLSLSDEERCK